MPDQNSQSSIYESFMTYFPDGSFGKTSQVCSVSTAEWISGASPAKLPNSGIALGGEYLTLNTSESPKCVVESSLSDIVELNPSNVLPKYYLSPRGCAGILRRARAKGKALPPGMEEILEAQCNAST